MTADLANPQRAVSGAAILEDVSAQLERMRRQIRADCDPPAEDIERGRTLRAAVERRRRAAQELRAAIDALVRASTEFEAAGTDLSQQMQQIERDDVAGVITALVAEGDSDLFRAEAAAATDADSDQPAEAPDVAEEGDVSMATFRRPRPRESEKRSQDMTMPEPRRHRPR